MTDNEIGYEVYCWDRKGYGFIAARYNPNTDYTGYLKYYTDPKANAELISRLTNTTGGSQV